MANVNVFALVVLLLLFLLWIFGESQVFSTVISSVIIVICTLFGLSLQANNNNNTNERSDGSYEKSFSNLNNKINDITKYLDKICKENKTNKEEILCKIESLENIIVKEQTKEESIQKTLPFEQIPIINNNNQNNTGYESDEQEREFLNPRVHEIKSSRRLSDEHLHQINEKTKEANRRKTIATINQIRKEIAELTSCNDEKIYDNQDFEQDLITQEETNEKEIEDVKSDGEIEFINQIEEKNEILDKPSQEVKRTHSRTGSEPVSPVNWNVRRTASGEVTRNNNNQRIIKNREFLGASRRVLTSSQGNNSRESESDSDSEESEKQTNKEKIKEKNVKISQESFRNTRETASLSRIQSLSSEKILSNRKIKKNESREFYTSRCKDKILFDVKICLPYGGTTKIQCFKDVTYNEIMKTLWSKLIIQNQEENQVFSTETFVAILELLLHRNFIIIDSIVSCSENKEKTIDLFIKLIISQKQSIKFIQLAIDKELNRIPSLNSAVHSLFRDNSFPSLLIAFFFRLHLQQFFIDKISPILQDHLKNPIFQKENQQISNKNEISLAIIDIVVKIFGVIEKSLEEIPNELKGCFCLLATRVREKFPGLESNVIAGFLFLRLICPIFVSNVDLGFGKFK